MSDYHCMIDLETLSVRNDAAIAAIGAVIFNSSAIVHRFSAFLDLKLVNGSRDLSTLEWWNSQDSKLRERVMGGVMLPWEALEGLSKVWHAYEPEKVWANAPTFDCTILRSQYAAWGIPVPWHFSKERCYRTLYKLASSKKIDCTPAFKGAIKHDPLSDAECQAKATQIILRALGC